GYISYRSNPNSQATDDHSCCFPAWHLQDSRTKSKKLFGDENLDDAASAIERLQVADQRFINKCVSFQLSLTGYQDFKGFK
ncbi:hypothetical protein R6Q59_027851, partial [Mikania micrantha]